MPDLKEIAAREKALKEEQSRTIQLGTKQLITIAQQLGSG
jgi:alkylhydroperoxidase/carboxymuconolactone decarboxylase family protein YurZ